MHAVVRRSGAARVLHLGCGDGDLFVRLVEDPSGASQMAVFRLDRAAARPKLA